MNKGMKFEKNGTGYRFISENGIEYSLLEGVTFGGIGRETSDICYIMLDGYDCPTEMAGWFYGVNVCNRFEDLENDIAHYVNSFEKSHEDLVEQIKSGDIEKYDFS